VALTGGCPRKTICSNLAPQSLAPLNPKPRYFYFSLLCDFRCDRLPVACRALSLMDCLGLDQATVRVLRLNCILLNYHCMGIVARESEECVQIKANRNIVQWGIVAHSKITKKAFQATCLLEPMTLCLMLYHQYARSNAQNAICPIATIIIQ